MTFVWLSLVAVVCGGIGWRNRLHRTRLGDAVTIAFLLSAAVGILMLRGTAQQVLAGAMVGLVLGDLAAAALAWRRRADAVGAPTD